jgi:eukaryotic-like serine/threonine-protein kinase
LNPVEPRAGPVGKLPPMTQPRPLAEHAAAPREAVRPPPAWDGVRALFERLVELPAAARRELLRREAVPSTLADEVWSLLGQHEAEEAQGDTRTGFLERPAWRQATADEAVEPEAPDRRGQRLGPWRLLSRLGQGGMGEVWEAARDDGAYEARVAVKLLPAGDAGDEASRQRLRAEQRALARLAHPHIARLLDAGESSDGHPYFVMEAVDGRPLDEACCGLPLAARLGLFLQLADAVAHAHRQGLVHRDLKPANVMVDTAGQVRLLDFGIAHRLAPPVAAGQPQAAPLQALTRALSPGYASPEQVRGEPPGPASDVYSLGVLLHRMLTGVRPYGLPSRGATTAAAQLRAALEETPTRPSEAPADNPADAGLPRRQLSGDLDAMVLKALAKAPADRYGSVDAMAADVRALLERRPVAARPATPWYVAGRFVSRHRGVVGVTLLALLAVAGVLGASAWRARDAAGALAVLALVAGLGVSSWQARRAAQARDEARQRLAQTGSLVRDVLMRYADMATYLPGGLRIKTELLTDALVHLERLHVSAPHDGLLASELAKAHARLADLQLPGRDTTLEQPDEARAHAERALALFPLGEAVAGHEPAFLMWWGRALSVRAKLQQQAGDVAAALQTRQRQQRFLRGALQRLGRDDDAVLRAELASTLLGTAQALDTWFEPSLGRGQEALALLAEAAELFQSLAAAQPADADVQYQLGTVAGARQIVLRRLGRLDEAIDAGREAVRQREAALALQADHTSYREGVAGECNNLAMMLLERGLVDEALAVTARGEALMQALQAEDPATALWPQRRRWFALHRGRALLAAGQLAPALATLTLAREAMAQADSGPTLSRLGWCDVALARCHLALGDRVSATAAAASARASLAARLAEAPGDADTLQRQQELDALGL